MDELADPWPHSGVPTLNFAPLLYHAWFAATGQDVVDAGFPSDRKLKWRTARIIRRHCGMRSSRLKKQGAKELRKVLDKVFERDGDPAQPPPTPEGEGEAVPTQREASPEEQLIEGVLDMIFGD